MQWLANSVCVDGICLRSSFSLLPSSGPSRSGFSASIEFPKVDFPTVMDHSAARSPAGADETRSANKLEESINTIQRDRRPALGVVRSHLAGHQSSSRWRRTSIVAGRSARQGNRALRDLARNVEQADGLEMGPDGLADFPRADLAEGRCVVKCGVRGNKVRRGRIEVSAASAGAGAGRALERRFNIWHRAAGCAPEHHVNDVLSKAGSSRTQRFPGGSHRGRAAHAGPCARWPRAPTWNISTIIVVKDVNGHQIYAARVARVEDGMADATSLVNVNG